MRGKHAARARRRRSEALTALQADYERRLAEESAAHAAAEEAIAMQIEQLRADSDEVAEALAAKAIAVAEHEADRVEVAAQRRHEELVADILGIIHSDGYGDEPWRPAESQAQMAAEALGVDVDEIRRRQ